MMMVMTIGFVLFAGDFENGYDAETKGDYKTALACYEKEVAATNDVASMFNIGLIYYRGKGMKEPDYKNALIWFKKAADAGDASAQYKLACIYYNGEGVQKDIPEGVRLLKKAALNGSKSAKDEMKKMNIKEQENMSEDKLSKAYKICDNSLKELFNLNDKAEATQSFYEQVLKFRNTFATIPEEDSYNYKMYKKIDKEFVMVEANIKIGVDAAKKERFGIMQDFEKRADKSFQSARVIYDRNKEK